MNEATVIYPHQLCKKHPALKKERKVYLVEESLLLSHNPIHRQKLIFHFLTLFEYEQFLKKRGYRVTRVSLRTYRNTSSVFEFLKKEGVDIVHIADVTDDYLEQAIRKSGLSCVWYESPLFFLSKDDAVERYEKSKKLMGNFYRSLRKDTQILIGDSGAPLGGAWSFDAENRKPLPKNMNFTDDICMRPHAEYARAQAWVKEVQAEQYGEEGLWLPTSFSGAQKYLKSFLTNRLNHFGAYEDAMTTKNTRVFHSGISALMNVGLLTPKEVLKETLSYAQKHNSPIASVEGFVRQILGWREFIRAAYEKDGRTMRQKNFWNHTRKMPTVFWKGETRILPIDISLKRAFSFGYTHHIERLMVLGNYFLLARIHPDEVYRWFMGLYIDAYDWVMVPNVYGMSQFADGGIFATKPYISGGAYIKKMSDYEKGDWEKLYTALFWQFISDHRAFFEKHPRLSMMARQLSSMRPEVKKEYERIAKAHLA